MAVGGHTLRRGLPRRPGEQAWPEAAAVAPAAVGASAIDTAPGASPDIAAAQAPVGVATGSGAVPVAGGAREAAAGKASRVLPRARRGLPRVAGGERWPVSSGPAPAVGLDSAAAPPAAGERLLRRGLPRAAGAAGWPPEGSAVAAQADLPAPASRSPRQPAVPPAEPAAAEPPPTALSAVPAAAPPAIPRVRTGLGSASGPGVGPAATQSPTPAAPRHGRYTRAGWIRIIVGGVIALAIIAVAIVLVTRWIMTLTPVHDFIADYSGHYPLPAASRPGFPAFVGWQHFFNLFLMVLIIRSGLQVRQQRTPPAYWTSRRPAHRKKISIMQWLHQSLDALWMINGVVFVVLLFATTQWMRIVPTSWAVFPNAVSALLQYLSLEWPVNESWVNYNSLQQLAYFATVFLAAPLAAATGYRLSTVWPARAERLGRAFPAGLARALHFPTMLYFVVFIIGHVALVLSTGAIRNLNAMWAGIDDGQSLIGFALLFGALVLIAAAWVAARPSILAPVARLFGAVSAR